MVLIPAVRNITSKGAAASGKLLKKWTAEPLA
jgi:hypothetical protein